MCRRGGCGLQLLDQKAGQSGLAAAQWWSGLAAGISDSNVYFRIFIIHFIFIIKLKNTFLFINFTNL